MTENKKKRGRPRKIESFQELKEIMQPAPLHINVPLNEYGVPENPNIELTGNEYTFEPKKRVVRKNGEVISETPYPSNWNELGKIAKLQWLTANRK